MGITTRSASTERDLCRRISRRRLLGWGSAAAILTLDGRAFGQDAGETTWKRILQTKTIRVGTVGTTKSSKVGLDGSFTGISPEILRQVMATYGVDKLVPVQMDFPSLIPALIANRIDVVANTLSVRKARCAQVAFANPEFNAREGFVVLKGNPKNLHGFDDIAKSRDARLGYVDGGFQGVFAKIAGVPKDRILTFPDQILGCRAVADGRIDAFGSIRFLLVGFLETINDPRLAIADPYKAPINEKGEPDMNLTAAAFRKEDNDLREAYNKGLANLMSSGKLLKIVQEQTGGNLDDMPPPGITAEKACEKE
ncbi:MAG TPA: transporter substrate-binding domain-containing protein [Pseudolabrys sp.]|nr:transporter substrate-binding domain-containing protein [Pseudolabrys sp.]